MADVLFKWIESMDAGFVRDIHQSITDNSFKRLLTTDGSTPRIRSEFLPLSLASVCDDPDDPERLVTNESLTHALSEFWHREVQPLRVRLDKVGLVANSLDSATGRLDIGASTCTSQIMIGGGHGAVIRVGSGLDRVILSGQISSTATFEGNDHVLGNQTVDGASILRGTTTMLAPLQVNAATKLASLRIDNLACTADAGTSTGTITKLVADEFGNVLRSPEPADATIAPTTTSQSTAPSALGDAPVLTSITFMSQGGSGTSGFCAAPACDTLIAPYQLPIRAPTVANSLLSIDPVTNQLAWLDPSLVHSDKEKCSTEFTSVAVDSLDTGEFDVSTQRTLLAGTLALSVMRMTDVIFTVLSSHNVLYADPQDDKNDADIQQVILPIPSSTPLGRVLHITNHNRPDASSITLLCSDKLHFKLTRNATERGSLASGACIKLISDGTWWRRISE
jgi:hypothetical protein